MLKSGDNSSITDLAAAEKINHSYVRRILALPSCRRRSPSPSSMPAVQGTCSLRTS